VGKLEFDSLSKIREDEGCTWSRGGNGAREHTGSVPDSEGLVGAGGDDKLKIFFACPNLITILHRVHDDECSP
jgi:hypothetical protein